MVIFIWMVFLLVPTLGCVFAVFGLCTDRKNTTSYSIMLALLLASFAYWFVPNHEMDLTRYFEQLSSYNMMPWNVFLKQVLYKSNLIIQDILFFLISKTSNYHLLPALVIFIVYGITFYMITDYSNKYDINSRSMIITLIYVIFVLPFPSLVSNIRNILSFAIFIFAIYREYEQNKRNFVTWLLYIIPIYIHISTVVLLIIRIMVPLYNKSKVCRFIISISTISVTFIIEKFEFLIINSSLNISFINAFLTKANNYINNPNEEYANYLQNNLFMNIQKVYFICIIVFLLIIVVMVNKSLINDFISDNNYYNINIVSFFQILSLIVIGTIPIRSTVYLRFAFPAIILSFIILLNYKKHIRLRVLDQIISIGLFISGLGGIIHQIVFMNELTNILKILSSVLLRNTFNMFIP